MTLRRFLPYAVLMVAGALLLSRPVSSSQTEKISARVLNETANGGSTEALVVLAEQADLSPASALQGKLAKGRYVVNTLRAVANRTQGPVLDFLRRRGVPYQAFYIVNMIKVTGNRALMEDLAARTDVAQIDANPHGCPHQAG